MLPESPVGLSGGTWSHGRNVIGCSEKKYLSSHFPPASYWLDPGWQESLRNSCILGHQT